MSMHWLPKLTSTAGLSSCLGGKEDQNSSSKEAVATVEESDDEEHLVYYLQNEVDNK